MTNEQIVTGEVFHPRYTDGSRSDKLYVRVDDRNLAVPYTGTLTEGKRGKFLMKGVGVMVTAHDYFDGADDAIPSPTDYPDLGYLP